MVRHARYHNSQSRYLCSLCGKGFNDSSIGKKHLRTHTGLKPYQCTECVIKYANLSSLKGHLIKIHQKTYDRLRTFVCELCGYIAFSCYDYSQHKKMHSVDMLNKIWDGFGEQNIVTDKSSISMFDKINNNNILLNIVYF